MAKILIITNPKDAHSRIVFECLKKKGAYPIRWYPEEYIINQTTKITISKKGVLHIKLSSENIIDLDNVDVVWNRRLRFPFLSKKVDPNDYHFVTNENRAHMQSLLMALGESATWVNPLLSYQISSSKIIQLREAARLEMIIPDTLVSNNKKAIVSFINRNKRQNFKTIYKSFLPSYWEESENSYNLYTSAVNLKMLPKESTIRLTPGIYQRAIEKKYEVRVTFFGDEHVAVKIHNSCEQDWRALSSHNLKISLIALPPDIEKKCLGLMKKLGIVFGCFDFIVTPTGQYVFLEVNEMGQFSWIEELLPNVRIVDRFCDFLINSSNFQMQKKTRIVLHKITNSESYKALLAYDKARHRIIEANVLKEL